MAIYKIKEFYPYEQVAAMLNQYGSAKTRHIWSIIGPRVVCSDPDDIYPVVDMFAKDPISYCLMTQINRYDVFAKKILIKKTQSDEHSAQHFKDISKMLNDSKKNPQLVIFARSRYAIILTEAEYGIDLYYWNLELFA